MKVDLDMKFRSNAAQKLVAEHCVSDFYMIFTLHEKFRHDFPLHGGSEIDCRAL